MSWFGKDNGVADLPIRRSAGPVVATGNAVRRGPVIRTSDFAAQRKSEPADPVAHAGAQHAPEPPAAAPAKDVAQAAGPVDAPRGGAVLLDGPSIARAAWKGRRLSLILAIAFAVGGAALAPMIPKKFTAGTSLYFDPKQMVTSSGDDAAATFNKDAFLAVVDSQMQILSSAQVVGATAVSLGLAPDPKASGAADGSARLSTVVGALQKALKITREDNTYIVNLSVTTGNGEQSAKVANGIVQTFLAQEANAASARYQTTNTVLDGRIGDLAAQLQQAEEAVTAYKAQNDLVSVDGKPISDQRLAALNELLVTTQSKTIDAAARASAAASLKVEDMVGNSSANDGSSQSLMQLRRQYATIAADVGSLESNLGSRHPRLLAARASLAGIRDEINRELQRYVAAAQADLQQARKAEQDVAKELTVQKALQGNIAERQIKLQELQRKSAAIREIYESVLKRTSRNSEDESLTTSNIRVISPATAPLRADGPGRSSLMMAAAFGGLILGLMIGVLISILRLLTGNPALRAYFVESDPHRPQP